MNNFKFLKDNGFEFRENEKLANFTTLKIGGPAGAIIEVFREEDLSKVVQLCIENNQQFMVIAAGSDLLVSDDGYLGIIIVNKTRGIDLINESTLIVQSGTVLQDLVDFANQNSLVGFENMAGIPGSVGGAIYGNAGAYGETVSDHLVSVKYFDGKQIDQIDKNDCNFAYRESIFKENKNWTILSAQFELSKGNSQELIKKSKETIELRSKKYPPGIKCPGSFFKNIIAENLSAETLKKIPSDKIVFGKIPAGYLLEEVGAKGDKSGDIEIATYHGNLFMNTGNGTSKDFFNLAKKYKERVNEKFGIVLEPEVQLIGFEEEL